MLKKHISADYSVFCIITTNYISSNSPVSESMMNPLPDCSCWSFANKSESKIREICPKSAPKPKNRIENMRNLPKIGIEILPSTEAAVYCKTVMLMTKSRERLIFLIIHDILTPHLSLAQRLHLLG